MGREGGMLQTDNTGVHSQCLSHTGSAPAHGACGLPAHSEAEQVSLNKIKKNSVLHRPLCVRAGTRRRRDQQTEEAITEGNALEATGHRLKPCGYYGLHRKGPIDLEKYKSD